MVEMLEECRRLVFFSTKTAVDDMEFMIFVVLWPESFSEACQRREYLSYIALKIVL